MKPLVLLIVLGLLTSFSRPLEPMTAISGTLVYPDGVEIPMAWWRVGLILARTEGPQLAVYREPELWLVDVPRRVGRHIVDPGPSLGFHVPVVLYRGDLGWGGDLLAFEVGRELEFMVERGVPPEAGVRVGEVRYRYLDRSGVEAELALDRESGTPVRVEIRDGGGPLVTLVYGVYRTGLPVDLRLFSEPAGVDFSVQEPSARRTNRTTPGLSEARTRGPT